MRFNASHSIGSIQSEAAPATPEPEALPALKPRGPTGATTTATDDKLMVRKRARPIRQSSGDYESESDSGNHSRELHYSAGGGRDLSRDSQGGGGLQDIYAFDEKAYNELPVQEIEMLESENQTMIQEFETTLDQVK